LASSWLLHLHFPMCMQHHHQCVHRLWSCRQGCMVRVRASTNDGRRREGNRADVRGGRRSELCYSSVCSYGPGTSSKMHVISSYPNPFGPLPRYRSCFGGFWVARVCRGQRALFIASSISRDVFYYATGNTSRRGLGASRQSGSVWWMIRGMCPLCCAVWCVWRRKK